MPSIATVPLPALIVGARAGLLRNGQNIQKPGDHPNFRKKRSRSERAILGALGEFRGILGATLGIGNSESSEYEIPFSEWPLTT